MKKNILQYYTKIQSYLMMFHIFTCLLLILYLNHTWVRDCITLMGILEDSNGISQVGTVNQVFHELGDRAAYKEGVRYLRSAGYEGIGKLLLYGRHVLVLLLFGLISFTVMAGLMKLRKIQKQQVEEEKGQLLQWVRDAENLHIETFGLLEQGGLDGALMDAVRNLKLLSVRKQDIYLEDRKQILCYMEDVSHHLKTPLAVIRTICEGIRNRNELTEEMENCMTQVEKMSQMISDLLKLGRYDYGKMKLEMKLVPIVQLIETIGQELDVLMMKKNLELDYEHTGPEDWYCDPEQIREAVENLLKNCIEHCQDGVIEIKTESAGSNHHLMIQDCGTGFSNGEELKLFERYSMGSRRAEGSSGLGLSITARIAELHYGRIHAENGKKGGAVFHLYLPNLEDEGIYQEPEAE